MVADGGGEPQRLAAALEQCGARRRGQAARLRERDCGRSALEEQRATARLNAGGSRCPSPPRGRRTPGRRAQWPGRRVPGRQTRACTPSHLGTRGRSSTSRSRRPGWRSARCSGAPRGACRRAARPASWSRPTVDVGGRRRRHGLRNLAGGAPPPLPAMQPHPSEPRRRPRQRDGRRSRAEERHGFASARPRPDGSRTLR